MPLCSKPHVRQQAQMLLPPIGLMPYVMCVIKNYAGIERTAADLQAAQGVLTEFSGIAVDWLRLEHNSLLK